MSQQCELQKSESESAKSQNESAKRERERKINVIDLSTSMSQRNGVQKRERNKHSAPKTESFKKTLQHNSEKREFK